jgi:hypothetical protein
METANVSADSKQPGTTGNATAERTGFSVGSESYCTVSA